MGAGAVGRNLIELRALGARAVEARGVEGLDGVRGRPSPLGAADVAGDTFEVKRTKGPYAALAARGTFDGFVTLASGEEVFVRVRPGKNPTNWAPVVYLDGLNGAGCRAKGLDGLAEKDGHTVVAIALRGQGETLIRDVEKGGASLKADIDPNDQVKLVVDTLDALGVRAPVNLMGLSYGGGIAALVKSQHPERVAKLMLAAPYTCSMSLHDPVRASFHALMNNPWNPLGQMMYRSVTQAALGLGVFPPKCFETMEQRQAFRDGIYRLTLGMEAFDLEKTLAGVEDVHVLAVPFDPISPPGLSKLAYQKSKGGSFTDADALWDAGKHDLVDLDPALLTRWAGDVLRGARKGIGAL
ncbi:alpha/beta hydrolase [Myxococcota bacterium]|nr:alpha/beta hydrolase [Myxococcota bacterium]